MTDTVQNEHVDFLTPYTLEEIVAFLCGEISLNNVWFGDRHPTEKGAFWWRKHLCKAIENRTTPAVLPVGDEREAFEAWAKYRHMNLERAANGTYYGKTHDAYVIWQASRIDITQVIRKLEEDVKLTEADRDYVISMLERKDERIANQYERIIKLEEALVYCRKQISQEDNGYTHGFGCGELDSSFEEMKYPESRMLWKIHAALHPETKEE